MFNGKKYIRTENKNEVILTSIEKNNGKKTTLIFTKDKNLSEQVEKNIKKNIKKSIIHNYLKKEQV